ncbi:LysM peptidoglycan-binding domain-containing protein [Microbispora sp. H10885]|uniref:LysM peptidoglycan-binding domain-containing protein n=1 Tax=Microbispora sp. H10885 TaxID=2729110 RepID=UPI0015FF2812|nr:LysM peptidoglycan-binding domain-containing protein [Microbispora sp. H10885]
MMTLSRLLRALVAAIVLTATVVGFPILFYRLVGFPLPDHIPTLQEIGQRLTARDDGTLFIAVLELIAWAAWAAFSLSVLFEIGARLMGARLAPRLSGLGGLQRLAAYLVASASLVATAPAAVAAEAAPPPVVAMAPSHALGGDVVRIEPPAAHEPVYQVEQGDSLWEIADDKLGSPRRWKQIWKLNAGSPQPDGRRFSNPGVIQPGWKLRLPHQGRKLERDTSRPLGTQQPAESASRPPAVQVEGRHELAESAQAPLHTSVKQDGRSAVELESGSLVALGYAAGISTAYVANRLRRRRRHTPPPASDPVVVTPEPKPDPAVAEARRAHIRSFTERGEQLPSDIELLRDAHSIDVPEKLSIGRRADGSPVEIALTGPGLSLTGDGAQDVAGYLLVDMVRQSSNFRIEVVVCSELAEAITGIPAEELDAMSDALPGLVVVPTADAALQHFEQTYFTRKYMLLEREASNIEELRERDPGEVLPTIVLVAEVDDEVFDRVSAPLVAPSTAAVAALLLGDWPCGTTCEISKDHQVVKVEGQLADVISGAELFHISGEEATAHLRELLPQEEPAAVVEGPAPSSVPESWSGSHLVRLSVLGPPTVHVHGRSNPIELGWLQLNALVYLALHPTGVTRDQLTTALWPEDTGKDVHNTLRHLRNALVTATGYENPERKRAPFINASTTQEGATYRIDPALVSVDLWDYLAALEGLKAASEPAAKLSALLKAAESCNGELAHGLETEWLDEHRYPLTRSQADVLSQLAELYTHQYPEKALDALERARNLDPDVEETYLLIIRLQLALGRRDDARRTTKLLRQRQHGLSIATSARTERLLTDLFRQD